MVELESVVVDEAEEFWLPSEFPYDIHETKYDAVNDIALRLAGKLKLDSAVDGPTKPIFGPGRNTEAHFHPLPDPSVFINTKFQKQPYRKRMARTDQFNPTHSTGPDQTGLKGMCAGTGVFLPRAYRNKYGIPNYDVDSDLQIKTTSDRASSLYGHAKNFCIPNGFPQTRSPFDMLIEQHHHYNLIIARRRQMILLQHRLRMLAEAEKYLMMGQHGVSDLFN